MYSKRDILGIRCEIIHNSLLDEDEREILIGGSKFFVKSRHLGTLEPVEKFAIAGESVFYIKSSGLIDFFPHHFRRYKIKINSRGYARELLVQERDLVLLNGNFAA